MNAEKRAPMPLDTRVEQMDMELKEHFGEFRTFVSESLDGLEARLTKRFDDRLEGVEQRLETRIDGVEQRLGVRIDGVEQRLTGIDTRLSGIDGRFDGIDRRFEAMDRRFDRLEGQFGTMQTQFAEFGAKLDLLVARHTAKPRRTKPAKRTGRRR